MTNIDAAPLPDIYGDLYDDTGEGNVLLKTQVAQVRDSIYSFCHFPKGRPFKLKVVLFLFFTAAEGSMHQAGALNKEATAGSRLTNNRGN